MVRALAAALAAVLAMFLATPPAARAVPADRIWQKGGGRPIIADAVTQDHYVQEGVKYRKGEVNLTLDGWKVDGIDYGDAPESWQRGLDKREEGDFENAVSLLRAAQAEKNVRAWVKVAGLYEVAETYRLWASRDRSHYADAIKAYDEALAADELTRIRPAILHGRAQAQLGAGDVEAALAGLDQLAQESGANKYGVEWELKAIYEKAQALDEAGRATDAKREFSKLETLAKSFTTMANVDERERRLAAEMAGLARLAQGRVLIRDGKTADAERFFREIARDENEVVGVRAAALVGMGEALQSQGKLKEAQIAFATVRVNYYSTDALAEATYRLGLVARELGTAEPKGSILARDYFNEVVQRFSGSRWAQKAQEELGN
ncbi:MAG: hypothetical protein HY812_08215 [Planctomycetes bacterium]|nr:hypothetical protein [Planctomycetota bacterium]